MSVTVEGEDRTGELTLAFTLSALEQFADPGAVFADAREWSRYVGVIDNDDEGVAAFVREHDLRDDFGTADVDLWLALQSVHEATVTPRYVLVGTDADHRRAAGHLGWEFRDPAEVARKADWTLADGSGTATSTTGESDGAASRTGRSDDAASRTAPSDRAAGETEESSGGSLTDRLRALVPGLSRSR